MAFYAVQVLKTVKTKVVWKERAIPPKSSEATYSKWVIKWGRCLFLELFFQGNVWKCITVGLGRLIVLLCGVQSIWFGLKSCPRLRIFLFCCCCVIVILQVSGEEGFKNVFWFILWTRSKLTLQSIVRKQFTCSLFQGIRLYCSHLSTFLSNFFVMDDFSRMQRNGHVTIKMKSPCIL